MRMMRVLLALATVALLTSIPGRGDAGGPADRFGMGRAGGFRTTNSFFISPSVLSMSPPFRFHNRSVWFPSIPQGSGAVLMAPPQVLMVPMVIQQVSREAPAPAPAPDPKFISPPTQNAPSQPGSHTVIVQRGSQIEVQSFPATR